MKKEMNNKGFSLVELIVVIAIMAVLVGILAPQFLRYVERSRIQKDNTAISEIANAVKTACADETIYGDVVTNSNTDKITASSGVFTITGFAVTSLGKDVATTVGNSVTLASKAYKNSSTQPTIQVDILTGGAVSVNCAPYYDNNGTAVAAGKAF